MSVRRQPRDSSPQARVLVVGDAMLDRYWFGAVERISPEAPVPVVRVNREEERLGGAANVASTSRRSARRRRCSPSSATTSRRAASSRCCEQQGIEHAVRARPAALHDRQAARHRPLAAADARRLRERARPRGARRHAEPSTSRRCAARDAVLFSDYGKGGLTHIPRMIELARAAGKPVLVDPKGSDYGRYARRHRRSRRTAPSWRR